MNMVDDSTVNNFSSKCEVGDLVKVVYELVDGIGSLSFYVNGNPVGDAPDINTVVGKVFPAVFLPNADDQVSIISL